MTFDQALLFGGIPAGASRATLRALHREHCRAARHPRPLAMSRAAHLNWAAACRRLIQKGA